MQQVRCPNCGSPNTFGQQFCGTCGSKMIAGCPNCGAGIDPGARFCGNCGARLSAGSQEPGMPQPGMQQPGMPQQGMQQPGGYGQPPGGMAQHEMWGNQPGSQSSSTTYLVVLLVVLIAFLGAFGYFAFFSESPPWAGLSSSTPSTPFEITRGPFVLGTTDNTTGKAEMTITWDTAELTIGRVEYSTDTSYGSQTEWESNHVKSHSISLSLDADTSYNYRIVMKDKKDNESTVRGTRFKTPN
jgi:hypothetical protein